MEEICVEIQHLACTKRRGTTFASWYGLGIEAPTTALSRPVRGVTGLPVRGHPRRGWGRDTLAA